MGTQCVVPTSDVDYSVYSTLNNFPVLQQGRNMVSLEQIFAQQAPVALIKPLIVSKLSEIDQANLLAALNASKAPRSYVRQVLRVLLTALESGDQAEMAPTEDVITMYASLMTPISSEQLAPRSILGVDSLDAPTDVRYNFGDTSLVINETRNTFVQFGGTGYRTWEAALALGDYLIRNATQLKLADRSVLELGAGTGLAGMIAASLGAKAVLTDGDPRVVERLTATVAANNLQAEISELYWSEDYEPGDMADTPLILAADVFYDSDLFPPFLAVLKKFLVKNAEVLVASTIRNEDTFKTFKDLAVNAHLHLEKVAIYDPADSPSEFFWFSPGPRIELYKVVASP